jgi:hypothetical protein
MALGFVESGFGGLVLVSVRRWGLGGFPLFGVTLAGSRPGGRPTSLRRQRSRQERRPRRAGRLLKLSLDQTTPLRCSQQAAGAELAGCARSDSCAGLPRLLLRCSAVRKGLSADTEPLLERRGSSTSLFTLRVRAKWMRLLPYPTVGCRVTPYGLIRPTMLFNAFRFSLFAFLIDNTCPC